MGIQRQSRQIHGLDAENMDDLVPRLSFVFKEVLSHPKQFDLVQSHVELFAEFSAKCGFCGLSEFDSAADRPVEGLTCDAVNTVEHEDTAGAHMEPHRDVSNRWHDPRL